MDLRRHAGLLVVARGADDRIVQPDERPGRHERHRHRLRLHRGDGGHVRRNERRAHRRLRHVAHRDCSGRRRARFDRRHHSGRNRTSSASFDVTTATAAPTISSFSPTSGPAGTLVRIAGAGFTGTTRVTFGGASAAFTVVSDTAVTATVPAAAETGPIAVTTSGGTATSSRSFRVTKH